jgi:hypothetical protein
MNWEEEKDRRNRQALTRLTKNLPNIFPPAVLARALGRPLIPPTPRLAIDSYWRAHPIRADRLARALAIRSGAPAGWTWQLGINRKAGLPMTFRTPPAPYRERAYTRGAGFCCVCGQPVYRFGWHVDLWNAGPNKNANWHCACVIAWEFWNAPSGEAPLLRLSLPKTLSKLTRGLRRNQNIIAHDCVGAPVPLPAVRPLQAATAAGSRDSSAAASAQYFAAARGRSTAFGLGRSRSVHLALSSDGGVAGEADY